VLRSVRWAISAVAAVCVVSQLLSATFLVERFETPNGSTELAQNLARTGRYEIDVQGVSPWRAFHLPGETLYLALGFSRFPPSLHRYLHVPIVVAFVIALALVAGRIGGPRLALATGLVAALDPFVIGHGPVWDDTFLAGAAEWSVLALLVYQPRGVLAFVSVTILAGYAAITRTESQWAMAALGLCLIAIPALRKLRRLGVSVILGVVTAVSLWGIRNALVLGVFFVGSSHDGQTLHQSNYSLAREAIVQTGVAQSYAPIRTPVGVTSELDSDRYYRREAWSYLTSRPVDAAKTSALKVIVSLTGHDFSEGPWSARNLSLVGVNVAIFVLAVPGGIRLKNALRSQGLEPLAIAVFVLLSCGTLIMLLLGPVGLRYRITLAGLLYVCAAAELLRVISREATAS
jgi:hypothetical protein